MMETNFNYIETDESKDTDKLIKNKINKVKNSSKIKATKETTSSINFINTLHIHENAINSKILEINKIIQESLEKDEKISKLNQEIKSFKISLKEKDLRIKEIENELESKKDKISFMSVRIEMLESENKNLKNVTRMKLDNSKENEINDKEYFSNEIHTSTSMNKQNVINKSYNSDFKMEKCQVISIFCNSKKVLYNKKISEVENNKKSNENSQIMLMSNFNDNIYIDNHVDKNEVKSLDKINYYKDLEKQRVFITKIKELENSINIYEQKQYSLENLNNKLLSENNHLINSIEKINMSLFEEVKKCNELKHELEMSKLKFANTYDIKSYLTENFNKKVEMNTKNDIRSNHSYIGSLNTFHNSKTDLLLSPAKSDFERNYNSLSQNNTVYIRELNELNSKILNLQTKDNENKEEITKLNNESQILKKKIDDKNRIIEELNKTISSIKKNHLLELSKKDEDLFILKKTCEKMMKSFYLKLDL